MGDRVALVRSLPGVTDVPPIGRTRYPYARQADVRHRLGCGPTAEDRRPLPLPFPVAIGMATDSGTWHPGKCLSKAACCASTTAAGAVSSAGAAAGSMETQTRASGFKATHAAGTAATKSRKKAMQLLMDGLVRPVAMPFQLVGSGARVASLEALAATLPSIAKKAEADVAVLLDTVMRAWTDGSLDADDLLPNDLPLKRVYALELACALPLPPPSQSLVNELSIDLSAVDRAVPQTSKEGVVTRLALDCHVDVRVTLAVPLQARLRGRAVVLPDATAQLRRARVRGELRVWWHVQTGVLRAAFMQRPNTELYGLQGGYLRLPACCLGVSTCLVGSIVEPIIGFALGNLNERQPFAMPFKAPTSIRIAATFQTSDKSLASMRGQLVKATKVLNSLANPIIGGKFNPDQGIPRAALRQAKGVLILTTLAGGAVASGMVGSGIVVAR